MKILVTGDRNWTKASVIREVLFFLDLMSKKYNESIILIEGGAGGVDSIAATIGRKLGFNVRTFPADWKKHGKKAGPIRNREMLDFLNEEGPELVLAFHDNLFNGSKGTRDCVTKAKKRGKPVVLINSDGEAITLSYTGPPEYLVQRTVWLPFREVWARKLL